MRVKPGRNGAYLSRFALAWASGQQAAWSACSAACLLLPIGRGASERPRALFSTQWEARGSHA